MKSYLAGFIPQHVSDGAVLRFLRVFSFRIPKCYRKKHEEKNRAFWDICAEKAVKGGFIEYQSFLTGMVLGNTRASVNSCEVIAVCNVRSALLHEDPLQAFPVLLSEFERRGVVFFGAFGTAPGKMRKYFLENGFSVEFRKGKELTEEEISELSGKGEAFVVTSYNDRTNIWAMVHTMCITKEEDGAFRLHNGGLETIRFQTLSEAVFAVNGGKSRPIALMAVRREGGEREN